MHGPARKVLLTRLWSWGGKAHGGVLRSLQIAELVRRAIPDAREFGATNVRTFSSAFRVRILLAAARGLGTIIARRLMPRDAAYLGLLSSTFTGHGLSRRDVVVFDADRMNGKAVAAAAGKFGLSLIAMPHNFEALIPTEWPPRLDLDDTFWLMRRDIEWLSRADRVWAIGTLDQELLQLFGIPARLLPYRPPTARRDELLAIRRQRSQFPSSHILILGSALNAPTRAGMVELLRFLRGHPVRMPLVVAGFGTETLAAEAGTGVHLAGEQSDASLRELLVGARALWVHQGPMTGALTRITEALIAGVPILANTWAARSVPANPGLFVYANLSEAAGLLKSELALPTPPDISRYEEDFVADLRMLADRSAP
jgi:hypothetical protein